MLSAAALRRRLLERQAPTPTAASPADDETVSPGSGATGVEPRSKTPVEGLLKKEASGTFEKMLLEGVQAPVEDDAYVFYSFARP